MVMGRDLGYKGHGFESWHRILHGHIFVVKIVMMFV